MTAATTKKYIYGCPRLILIPAKQKSISLEEFYGIAVPKNAVEFKEKSPWSIHFSGVF